MALHLVQALLQKHLSGPMVNLLQRSYEKELLDSDDIPFADIRQNMKELNHINTFLGGHSITLQGVRQLIKKKTQLSICEIGCGGGDNLHAINKWLVEKKISAHFTGIDIKEECISYAKKQYPALPASWVVSDYKLARLENKQTIIFSSLFCHHFDETELTLMMKWMKENSTGGFFINDLHRHVLAYYSIKWLTKIFSRSYLVKNDAPLSVARGFKRNDWKRILDNAGIRHYSIQWKWAFRYLVVVKNE